MSKSKQTKYKLYAIDKYNKNTQFIENGYKEYNITKLIKELENDKGYHMRISDMGQYIFYGDCDSFNGSFDEFSQMLIDFLNLHYNINISDQYISYTSNDSKPGSYHYSIPTLYASSKKLKEIHKEFYNKHKDIFTIKKDKKNTKVVDTSVYGNQWFRYPNQSKAGDSNAKHIVKHGNLIDFIVEYIPENSLSIDNKQYKKNRIIKKLLIDEKNDTMCVNTDNMTNIMGYKMDERICYVNDEISENTDIVSTIKKNETTMCKSEINKITKIMSNNVVVKSKKTNIITEINNKNNVDDYEKKFNYSHDDVESLLIMLSLERCDEYKSWIEVGMCLYNINKTYLLLWKSWSQKSNKYTKGICEKKWKSFSEGSDNKLTIATLMYWCKSDNSKEYDLFIKEKKTNNIINKKFPKIQLEIGNTYPVTQDMTYTTLNNDNCLIYGDNHGSPSMYIERMKDTVIIKCRHIDCFGKVYPCEHILLSKNEMNIINNGTVNVTINNYGNDSNDLMKFPKFKIFEDDNINNLIFNSLNGSHATMADIIYYYFKNEYMYGEDDNWYIFKNHKWKLLGPNNKKLSLAAEKKLKSIYIELINFAEISNIEERVINELRKIRKSFETAKTKRDIMSIIEERFAELNNPDGDFVKNLNINRYLIVFNNGVYDLKSHTFREGQTTDFMSMSVDYDYIDKHSDKCENLLQFLSDIQPDEAEREFLLTYLSHALYGNMLEWFTILTGTNGRNGKSKFIELIKKVFGDYYTSVSSQLLTRPQPDASSPDPGLLNLKNKKIVIASEPEKASTLNTGFIKFITGRDSTQLRECHSNKMIDFSPMFILFFVCNDIPDTDEFDNAFSKRVKCINFPIEFCDNPVNENQRLINTKINENFIEWRSDFMFLLIKHYKKYMQTQKIVVTDKVLKWTNMYKENTDIYLKFVNECTEEANTHIRTSKLYEIFTKWHTINISQKNIPGNKVFIANLKKYKNIEKIKDENSVINGVRKLKIKQFVFDDV